MDLFTSNVFSFIIGGLLGFSINIISKRIFYTNKEFFSAITVFRKKLPPNHKKADIKELAIFSHMQLDNLKHNITQSDIDMFLKELESIDYSKIVFKRKYIEDYSRNIQRIIKTTTWDKFLIGILDEMLDEDKIADRKLFLINKSFYNYIGL